MRLAVVITILFFSFSNADAAGLPRTGTCGSCHVEDFSDWKSSAHARSISSEGFQNALKRYLFREDTAEGSFCFRCHAPLIVISGRIFEATDSILRGKSPAEGVTCVACHGAVTVKKGRAVYDLGESPAYHRVNNLRLMDREALCNTCHSSYKQAGIVKAEKKGFMTSLVLKLKGMTVGGKGEGINHGFSAVVATMKGGSCPGLKGN